MKGGTKKMETYTIYEENDVEVDELFIGLESVRQDAGGEDFIGENEDDERMSKLLTIEM